MNGDGQINTMNYKIIADEAKVRAFVDFLPDLQPDEQFYFSLFCRKKYWPYIKADKGQLKRGTTTKERLVQKIRQLECEIGAYDFEGKEIPNDALSFYLMPNPRNMVTAGKNCLLQFAKLVANNNTGYNPQQEALSQIQISKSRSVFTDFDFDNGLPELNGIINPEAYKIVKTRGGFHVLVILANIAPEFRKTFYKGISNLGSDVEGDCLLPVPGTFQGGVQVEML